MFPVGSELREVIFPQPKRIRYRSKTEHRFNPPPQAGSLISLMYPLKPGSGEHIARCLRIAAVQQQAGPALSQPLILERRNGIEPMFAFAYRCGAQGGKCLVPLGYHLWMKRNRWRLDCAERLRSLTGIVPVNEPEPSGQRPPPVIVTI